jgi:ketosteroid isomerase-like protein
MIGAVIAKKQVGSVFDAFNRRDLATFLSSWAEDVIWNFPGNIPISGETKGKKAVEACFKNYLAHFPHIKFTIKNVFISNIFAMGPSNNVAVEWDITETNREGKVINNSGVSIISIKGGKAVDVKEYLFNTAILKEAWGKD